MIDDTNKVAIASYNAALSDVVNKIYAVVINLPVDNCGNKEAILELLKKDFTNDIADYGDTEPTAYELKHCLFDTVSYKEQIVPVFYDELNQVTYFYFNGTCQVCDSRIINYVEQIKNVIDKAM